MKFLCDYKIKKKNGKYFVRVQVFTSGRGGTHSPVSIYLKYRNRWISPLEQRLRWDPLPLIPIYLKAFYSESMKDLVYNKNPFLKLIPKTDGFSGAYLPIPLVYND